jgi:hypothetical protein
VWAPIRWSCAARTPVERTFAKDRAPRTQVSPARPRQISGPAAGVTGAPRGGAKIENFGLLYVDYATQQAHAEAERIVLPGGRRAKPAGVIRSRRPGGAVDGSAYAEECGVASKRLRSPRRPCPTIDSLCSLQVGEAGPVQLCGTFLDEKGELNLSSPAFPMTRRFARDHSNLDQRTNLGGFHEE